MSPKSTISAPADKQSRKLLSDEHPLQLLPTLALAVGMNEAIVLQQVHYWAQRSKNIRDGHVWVFNSIESWQKQFPFWSKATVKRAFTSLRERELLVAAAYNRRRYDRTLWYRIDYSRLAELVGQPIPDPEEDRKHQLATMPYEEYLKTPEWAVLRTEALKRAEGACQTCNRSDIPLHTHHRTYERRGHERLSDLIVLCADCHKLYHFGAEE